MEFPQERCGMVMTFLKEDQSVNRASWLCIFCSLAICSEVMPVWRELQLSLLDWMRERASSAAASTVGKGRMELILRSSR